MTVVSYTRRAQVHVSSSVNVPSVYSQASKLAMPRVTDFNWPAALTVFSRVSLTEVYFLFSFALNVKEQQMIAL